VKKWSSKDNKFAEDSYTRILKTSLVVLSIFFYSDAMKANVAVKNSYLGFNHGARSIFQQKYTNYQIVASITLGFFAYSSTRAYVRFGRDENCKNLNIEKREQQNLDDLTSLSPINDRFSRIEFIAEKTF
jgi:hypothetical protein